MTFRVDPAALRRCASELADAERVADVADRYATHWGSFDFHESGIIGKAAPGHRRLVASLHQMLPHLGQLGAASASALRQTADHYERTDQAAEAKIDATYPQVPRSRPDRH
jgi:uncharacterized protein YukE